MISRKNENGFATEIGIAFFVFSRTENHTLLFCCSDFFVDVRFFSFPENATVAVCCSALSAAQLAFATRSLLLAHPIDANTKMDQRQCEAEWLATAMTDCSFRSSLLAPYLIVSKCHHSNKSDGSFNTSPESRTHTYRRE